jgi:hypothetical protein
MDSPHKRLPRLLLEPLRPCLCIAQAHGVTFSDTDVTIMAQRSRETLWNLHTTINRKVPACPQGVSACCKTPVPLWLALSSTHCTPCIQGCWTILHAVCICHWVTSVCDNQEINKACRYRLAEDIEAVAVQWPRIPCLVHQRDACLSARGDYFYHP